MDIKEIKKKIKEDWIDAFPHLSAFAQNKFYKTVGCFVIGIEAVNIPNIEGYKPHLVLYSLWDEDLKKSLETPYVYQCIVNNKGLQFSTPYIKHRDLFNEAVECFKKQIPFSLNDNVTLKSIFELSSNRFNDILIKSNSAQQAKIFELKFYAALYTGNQAQIENVLSEIQRESKSWNMRMFDTWYGKFESWFQKLQEKVNNREEFLKQININKQEKKISQLKSSELYSINQ